MLKVEYPCHELLSSYQNQLKPTITWAEAKKHLNDVRLRRQNQLALNIDECHKLRTLHKQLFSCQFDSHSNEKPSNTKSIKPINNDYSLPTNKYSTPRIEYAPIIYQKAVPTFEVESSSRLENEITIVKELSQYVIETTYTISYDKIENHRSLSPIKPDHPRRLSVSSVSSLDKRANKVYENWPDYNQISEIVGYRIDPPLSKLTTSNGISSRPSATRGQRKRNTTTGFTTASRQIKHAISLNPLATRQKSAKTKQSTKTDVTTATIDKPSIEHVLPNNPIIKEDKPKLPNILCPSSVAYSNRIQTRQWLTKNNFSLNAIRTQPLL